MNHMPRPFELWSFREDVHVEVDPDDDTVTLHSRWGEEEVRRPGPMIEEVLHRMSLGPISLKNIIGEHAEKPGDRDRLRILLDRLQYLVVRSFGPSVERPVISVVPLAPRARFRPVAIPPDVPIRLSRFALLQTDGNDYRLESPLSLHRIVLHRAEEVCLIGALARAITPSAIVAERPSPDLPIADTLSYLAAADMIVSSDGTEPAGRPAFAEDTDATLVAWSAVDLMFHTRSTLGRHDNDFGATYPLGEPRSPEPVVKPAAEDGAIALFRPDVQHLRATDPPLTAVIEDRCSTHDYGGASMTARQLGELLYRTARVRSIVAPADAGNPPAQTSDRPYPSGGGAYELDLYVTVHECAGIPPGLYHYDPLHHRLEPLDAAPDLVDEVLENGRLGANLGDPPPVLITMTARFRRLTWKYCGLTYALILKNVGVLMQTLYLVSTAMGLGACAVASGDMDVCSRAFGTNWLIESSVGDFIVGPRRGAGSAARSWPGN